MISNSSARFYL